MKLSEVLQLKEAGYTAEEITSLANVITEEPETTPIEPAKEENSYLEKISALETKLNEMAELIQKQAIQSSSIPDIKQDSLLDIANTILGGK